MAAETDVVSDKPESVSVIFCRTGPRIKLAKIKSASQPLNQNAAKSATKVPTAKTIVFKKPFLYPLITHDTKTANAIRSKIIENTVTVNLPAVSAYTVFRNGISPQKEHGTTRIRNFLRTALQWNLLL